MYALSLWQPWATLVAIGAKRIETRGWHTNYRGPLAIHAGSVTCLNQIGEQEHFKQALQVVLGEGPLPKGAVIAVAVLRACWQIRELSLVGRFAMRRALCRNGPDSAAIDFRDEENAFGDFRIGRWLWILEDVRRLAEPIKVRGLQKLFQVDLTKASYL